MSLEDFDRGYWYSVEIKAFAKKIGISPVSKLRKDELEKLIRQFLNDGKIKRPERKSYKEPGPKDIELGLRPSLKVGNYSDVKETKDFIAREANKIVPALKKRSGAQYRLNRWREDQINAGVDITYKDLITKYIELNQSTGSFKQAPSGRYINFVSDYMKGEKNATRKQAIKAWHELKMLDLEKNYAAWREYLSQAGNAH